jgi:hypothetical protein
VLEEIKETAPPAATGGRGEDHHADSSERQHSAARGAVNHFRGVALGRSNRAGSRALSSARLGTMSKRLAHKTAKHLAKGPTAPHFGRLTALLELRRRVDFEDKSARHLFLHLAFSLRDLEIDDRGDVIRVSPREKDDVRWEVLFDGGGEATALRLIDEQIRFIVGR